MKKILTLVLALCMLSSYAFAEDLIENIDVDPGFPVVKEPISVTIALVPQDAAVDFQVEQNWMTEYINRNSGLDIEWMVIDSTAASERIPLMLNSGDMPDAILGRGFQANDVAQYGMSEGMFYPVNELLDYMPIFSAFLEENPAVANHWRHIGVHRRISRLPDFRKKRSRRLRNHVGTDAGNRLQALRRPPRNPRKKHHENESPRPVRNLHGILRLLARAPRRGAGQVSRAPKFKGGKGCKDCPFGLAAANIAIADPPCFPSVKIAHLGGRRWRFPDAVFWRALPPRRSRRLLP